MSNNITESHKNRSFFEISGPDRKNFIQGLITNDITKIDSETLIYSAMLSQQGRFLYDFFIFEIDKKLIFDCHSSRIDEIIKKLGFFKLRSNISIAKNDDFIAAYSNFESKESDVIQFQDPRSKILGYRVYCKKNQNIDSGIKYDLLRIQNKIPEGESDLTHEKSFILEFGLDNLNAVDYQKGCYIGQELTARTHYRGEIRKKIVHLKIPDKNAVKKNAEITCEGKPIGIILSSVFSESELHALALIKPPQNLENFEEKLMFEDLKLFIVG